ncbi:dermatan-sulfate epimerase-like protein [Exaiptasia diaphana]|uniref:Heparinase II N-terminal domain-containing protein n=1 Tax=Exaiptasia diaphana TaxID=2652724 RepID=A0A913WZG0_EXADI|nr:dermatan-sulfate epimerase-like protein [Exaiptasia diaphana]
MQFKTKHHYNICYNGDLFKLSLDYKLVFLSTLIFSINSSLCETSSLYFSTSDVPSLRAKARLSHSDIFDRIGEAVRYMKRYPNIVVPPSTWIEFSSKWNENFGNNLACLSFYCLLNRRDVEAFKIARRAIVRFTELKNWRCSQNLQDDVPVAHSLVGMATAYDFIGHRFDKRLQNMAKLKIINVTRQLYENSINAWWGNSYIQNHVATNYVALLIGGLVMRDFTEEAEAWVQRAHLMLNRTMFLLGFVKDGSLEEGTSYASYTTRSLTQYVFLVKRHLNINLANNPWLNKHFWFIYRTLLPTFDKTLGIADSSGGWFYGPESQLMFLDSMVMRNGWGNWLAKNIARVRKDRKSLLLARTHRYASLHTEFLFYDHVIGSRPPADMPMLHVFEDWGVVVYGKAMPSNTEIYSTGKPQASSKQTNSNPLTYLTFKCGVLHGRAINRIVKTKPWSWIDGWPRFNPGHEHPDHGSFTYYPNGVALITDALYGPKYTWLNNVLMFGSTENTFGQLGEGGKWFKFQDNKVWEAEGTIITAIDQHQKLYIVGEYSKWYSSNLGLHKVFRSLLLLRQDILIVFDVVIRKKSSPTTKVSTFFHNRFFPFQIVVQDSSQAMAELTAEDNNTYCIQWINSDGPPINASSQQARYKAEFGKRKTNFLNITSPLKNRVSIMAYVMSNGDAKIVSLQNDNRNGILTVDINNVRHAINLSIIPDILPKYSNLNDYVSINTYETDYNSRSRLISLSSESLKICFLAALLLYVRILISRRVYWSKSRRLLLTIAIPACAGAYLFLSLFKNTAMI